MAGVRIMAYTIEVIDCSRLQAKAKAIADDLGLWPAEKRCGCAS